MLRPNAVEPNGKETAMSPLQAGAWAGILATGPMTMVLMKSQEERPELRGRAHAPAALTADLTRGVLPRRRMSDGRKADLTLLAHFAFGAAAGALFGLAAGRLPGRAKTQGAAFGLLVWAVSYMGWIRALNLRPAATRVSGARNAQMVGAHLAWGTSLGLAFEELIRFGDRHWSGDRSV